MEEEKKQEQTEVSGEKKANKKPLIIAIVSVIVVALIVCGVFLFAKNKQDHAATPILFSFEAANYDPETGSGIPVYIEGMDLDGIAVSKLVLVDEGNTDVELLRGEYDILVAGSPVNAEGEIYTTSEDAMHLVINENEITVNDEVISKNENGAIALPVIKLTAVKAKDVTDKQISAIKTWMIDVGFSGELVTKFEDLVVEKREAGIKQAEEEALAAWRTKISGTFSGIGVASGPPSARISCSLDGDKLTVRGSLNSKGGSHLSGSEWHFVLTEQTRYSYTEEFSRSTSRADFVQCFPSSFVVLDIQVQDGYVISMDTHA